MSFKARFLKIIILVVYNYRLVSLKGYLLFTFQCTFLIFTFPVNSHYFNTVLSTCQHFFKIFFKYFFEVFFKHFFRLNQCTFFAFCFSNENYFNTYLFCCQHFFEIFLNIFLSVFLSIFLLNFCRFLYSFDEQLLIF